MVTQAREWLELRHRGDSAGARYVVTVSWRSG